jgi:hypothetical protein
MTPANPQRRSSTKARRIDLHSLQVGRERIASHSELIAAGLSRSTIGYRIATGGRWQRVHPGVVAMHRGRLTWRERVVAALTYCGPRAVLTGGAALRLHGLTTADASQIHVLIPIHQRRQAHGGALPERTRRLPEAGSRQGLPVASLGRAVVDACRRVEDLDIVRNLVSDAVQNHGLDLEDLSAELRASARQRTGPARAVLAEIAAGVRFAAEARARQLFRERGLPEPVYNVDVLDDDGNVIVRPDGLFPEWMCGYQIDSRAWHLSPDSYEATLELRAYALRFGLVLTPATPTRIFRDPDGFITDILGTIETCRQRVPPALRWRPHVPPTEKRSA